MDWWDRRLRLEVKIIWTIVIVAAAILALAAYGYFTDAWDHPA